MAEPRKVSAFDLEGTLLRPDRPLNQPPHVPADFYVYSSRLVHALIDQGHDTVLVTRAEQRASEEMVQKHGIPTMLGPAMMHGVLGGEQSYLADGAPGVVYSNGDKGIQLKYYLLDNHNGEASVDFAVGDTSDDVPMLAMARRGVAINPHDRFRSIAIDRGYSIVDELYDDVTITNPGERPLTLSVNDIHAMPPVDIIGLVDR